MSRSTDPARFHVLIPCAGTGSRSGDAIKQYRSIAGKPMVQHTIDAFRALSVRWAGLLLVVGPDDAHVQMALPDFPIPGETVAHCGGATRAETVLNGLHRLGESGAEPHDWVLVHDAARCLVTPELVEALMAACEHDPIGGLLALPLPDTLKAATTEDRVAGTLDRAGKWLAQTPQMFRIGMLADALAAALASPEGSVTDEAGAIEAAGFAPMLVRGSAQNLKVTYPEDFALAEALLIYRQASS